MPSPKIEALNQKRADAVAANAAIIAKAASENDRDLTAEENASLDANTAVAQAARQQIERLEAQEQEARSLTEIQPRKTAANGTPLPGGEFTNYAEAGADAVRKASRIIIPATVRRVSSDRLAIFAGATTEEKQVTAFRAGRWLQAAIFGNSTARQWCSDNGLPLMAVTGQWEGSNSAGGYLVPEEVGGPIAQLLEEYGIFRRYARVESMSSETKTFHRRVGVATAYPVAEGGAGTLTTQAWEQVMLVAKTWQVDFRYTMELSEDATIDFAASFLPEAARALAVKEDQCGFAGNGTQTYHGIRGIVDKINDASGVTYAASIYTAAAGNTTFATLDDVDFLGAMGQLPMFPGAQPKWYISKIGWSLSMARMQFLAMGNNMTDKAGGVPLSFAGAPVVIVPDGLMNQTTGADTNAIKALYGDLSLAATVGDRRGIALSADPFTLMSQRQVNVYCTARSDLIIHALGTATAAGPMIALKTPGA